MRFFVSYSREDSKAVAGMTSILRLAASVFRDEDGIAPGQLWRSRLVAALADANILLVFWSRNSKASRWVAWEIRCAKRMGKLIVPVLLDGTPLPRSLAQFQAISMSTIERRQDHSAIITRNVFVAELCRLTGHDVTDIVSAVEEGHTLRPSTEASVYPPDAWIGTSSVGPAPALAAPG